MGERLSNALKALAGGLQNIAAYRADKEVRDEDRAARKEDREAQNAFQERLLGMTQAQQEKMFAQEKQYQTESREDTQLFNMEMFNKQSAIQERQFAQEMSARWAGIRAQAAAAGGGAGDRQLTRQLGVYETQIKMAAGEYEGLQKQMNEEVKSIADDKMLALQPEQMKAARQAIMDRYQPQLQEAKAKIDLGMKTYSEAVGIDTKANFSDARIGTSDSVSAARPITGGAMSGGMAATGAAMNEERVAQAVQAARTQLGSALTPGTMPSEADLVAGFEKSGLTRAESVKAARQLQRQASGDRFTRGR